MPSVHLLTLRFSIYFSTNRGVWYCDKYACLSVSFSVCSFILETIHGRTSKFLYILTEAVAVWLYDTLCTSGFAEGVRAGTFGGRE